MKRLIMLFVLQLLGLSIAQAEVATFTNGPVLGCPACTITDTTGLQADAEGHSVWGYPTGWDVWANPVDHLVVVNGIGADFSVPGTTFDLNRLKLFAYSYRTKTTAPLTFNLLAYHRDNANPDIIPFTIPARIISNVQLSGYTQLKNLTKVSVVYPATSYIGKVYFIETEFTPH